MTMPHEGGLGDEGAVIGLEDSLAELRLMEEGSSSSLSLSSSPHDDEEPSPSTAKIQAPPPPPAALHRRETSISEAANAASGGWDAPWWLSWFEVPFHVKDPKDGKRLPEATGWAMDSAARGPLNQVGGFIGSAVLILATKEAGCQSPTNCTNTVVGGLQPSSLLTATSAIVGVIAAIVMPFIGVIVDHTRHRKLMGVISGVSVVGMTGILVSISVERNNWLFILIIDAIQSFSLLVHATSVFAYLPDLTTDEEVIPHYTAHFNIRQLCAQFIFTSLIIIAGEARNMGTSVASIVQTAKDAAGMTFGIGVLFIGYAWIFLFRKRPALSKVPEGQNLLNTGFIQVKRTSSKIWADYRALKWFMISLLWSPEAGAGVVLSIAVSFLTIDLLFTGLDIAKIFLVLMVATIIGAFCSKMIMAMINPLRSYRISLLSMAIFMALFPALVDSPEKKNAVYGFAFILGFNIGWCYPTQRVLFCTLIPKGQETEMMGLFTFAGQIFGWLPPLIVTILNEHGVQLRFGLVVVAGFCLLAAFCTLFMGSYHDATAMVAHDSEAKLKAVLEATCKQAYTEAMFDSTASLSSVRLQQDNESDEQPTESAASAAESGILEDDKFVVSP